MRITETNWDTRSLHPGDGDSRILEGRDLDGKSKKQQAQ